MNPFDYLKAWARDNPVQARYLLTAIVGAVTAATGAQAELVLVVLTLVGGWAMQSTKARVTPEHRAQDRIRTAVAAENVRHKSHVSTMGTTEVHQSKAAPRKRAPKKT